MKPMQFIKEVLPEDISLYPEQEKLLTEFYNGTYRELFAILGRRSGKDLLLSIIALYECHRLMELKDPFKHYNIPKGKPIHVITVSPSSALSNILFTEIKERVSLCNYFKNKIDSIESDKIWFKDKQNKPSICLMCGSSNSDKLLGHRCFCLIFNDAAFIGDDPLRRLYSALPPGMMEFKLNNQNDGHIITMSTPDVEDSLLHYFVNQKRDDRLIWKKATWEINPYMTEELLRREHSFMSEEDFEGEFGAKFRKSNENTTISIRLPEHQLETIKRLAREKAYKNDTDISYVDIIRSAIQDYLKRT